MIKGILKSPVAKKAPVSKCPWYKTRNEKNEEKLKGGVYNHLSKYDVMKLRAMRP